MNPHSGPLKAVILILSFLVVCPQPAAQEQLSPEHFRADFDYMLASLRKDYAYSQKKRIDWDQIENIYRPQLAKVKTRSEFVSFLEQVLDELYDNHTSLNTNLNSSPRLVPTGLDVWAEWIGGRAVITQLRSGFSADQAGLKVGMEIVSVNGESVRNAVRRRLPKAVGVVNADAHNWALRAVLAGTHDRQRVIEARNRRGVTTVFKLDLPTHIMVDHYEYTPKVEWKILPRELAYIRINDLISTEIVVQFDAALEQVRQSRGLILDLRDIPRGGNTDVAESILGRLINRRMGYQQVVPLREPTYIKQINPKGWIYNKPTVVLVNRWTGSMGEGMAIGLDGMKRATVVGTRMAGLNGGIFDLQLPHTKIGVTYAGERLNHINGSPRENFVPSVLVNFADRKLVRVKDPILEIGRRTLIRLTDR